MRFDNLNISFILHANQYMSPYRIKEAVEHSYSHILPLLIDIKDFPINLHFSGTLLSLLKIMNPEIIDYLKKGTQQGNFEIIGSTYAQNVPYASSREENENQIDLHRKILKNILNAEPKLFWNAERCWYPELADIIKKFSYKYIPVESHIIADSSPDFSEQIIREYNDVYLLCDDEKIRRLVTKAINRKQYQPVIDYLTTLHEKQSKINKPFLVVYGEDMEAWGHWAFQRGESIDLKGNIEGFISELNKLEWLKITNISNFFEENKKDMAEISIKEKQFTKGYANWMNDEVKIDGFADWYDYIERHEGTAHYKKLHVFLWDKISSYDKKIKSLSKKNTGSEKLIDFSKWIYAIYQYEFGCSPASAGSASTRYYMCDKGRETWELVRTSLASAEAANASLDKSSYIKEYDVNCDDINEIILKNEKIFVVLSKIGGRILYLFDLEKGIEIMGGEFLVKRNWTDDNEALSVYNLKDITHLPRRKGFCDDILVNNEFIGKEWVKVVNSPSYNIQDGKEDKSGWISATPMDYSTKNNSSVIFSYEEKGIQFTKKYTLSNNELKVEYSIQNNNETERKLVHTIENGFYLDLYAKLIEGKVFEETQITKECYKVKSETSEVKLFFPNNLYQSIKNEHIYILGGDLLKSSLNINLSPKNKTIYEFKLFI